jgi:hypothetical protein
VAHDATTDRFVVSCVQVFTSFRPHPAHWRIAPSAGSHPQGTVPDHTTAHGRSDPASRVLRESLTATGCVRTRGPAGR